MTNKDENNKSLTDEEKRKKQQEIAERLAEIKNKLSSKPGQKPKPAPSASESKTPKKEADKAPAKSTGSKSPVKKASTPAVKEDTTEKTKDEPAEPQVVQKKADTTKTTASHQNKEWSANQMRKLAQTGGKAKSTSKDEIEIKPITNVKKGKKIIGLFMAVVIVCLLALAGWFFFLNDDTALHNNTDLSEEVITEELTDDNNPEAENEASPTETKEVQNKVEEEDEQVAKSAIQSSPAPEKQDDKWGLERPCYIISYVSTSREANAKKQSAMLTSKGFSSGYYWIPDYLNGGPSLYKVYVGPFNSKAAAKSSLSQVRRQRSDAYVQHVD